MGYRIFIFISILKVTRKKLLFQKKREFMAYLTFLRARKYRLSLPCSKTCSKLLSFLYAMNNTKVKEGILRQTSVNKL